MKRAGAVRPRPPIRLGPLLATKWALWNVRSAFHNTQDCLSCDNQLWAVPLHPGLATRRWTRLTSSGLSLRTAPAAATAALIALRVTIAVVPTRERRASCDCYRCYQKER